MIFCIPEMQTGAKWLLFFYAFYSLDHQGKCTGKNDDHKGNAHKEIFHDSSLRVSFFYALMNGGTAS